MHFPFGIIVIKAYKEVGRTPLYSGIVSVMVEGTTLVVEPRLTSLVGFSQGE